MIPPYGVVNPGDERSDLPPEVAKSFVDQNLARWKSAPRVKKETDR